MKNLSRNEVYWRQNNFKEELNELLEQNLISEEEYNKLLEDGDKLFAKRIENIEERKENIAKYLNSNKIKNKTSFTFNYNVKTSLILVLGVILTLISGITYATTMWDSIPNSVKIISVIALGGIFFLLSLIVDKKLKIPKTSLAFWILGCLYIPITALAVAYLGLISNYWSLDGGGRYYFGLITALICLPIYYYSSTRYKSRSFVFITYLTVNVIVFFLAKVITTNNLIDALIYTIFTSIICIASAKMLKYKNIFSNTLPPTLLLQTIIAALSLFIFSGSDFKTIIPALIILFITCNSFYLSRIINITKEIKILINMLTIFFVFLTIELTAIFIAGTVNQEITANYFCIPTLFSCITVFLLCWYLNKKNKCLDYQLASDAFITAALIVNLFASFYDINQTVLISFLSSIFLILILFILKTRYLKYQKEISNIIPATVVFSGMISYFFYHKLESIINIRIHFGIIVAALFIVILILKHFKVLIEKEFFFTYHALVPVASLLLIFDSRSLLFAPALIAFYLASYIYSYFDYKYQIVSKDNDRIVLIILGLAHLNLLFVSIIKFIDLDITAYQYVIPITIGVLILIYYLIRKLELKKVFDYYIVLAAIIGIITLLNTPAINIIFIASMTLIALIFTHQIKKYPLIAVASVAFGLKLLNYNIEHLIVDSEAISEGLIINVTILICAFVSLITGFIIFKKPYIKEKKEWYDLRIDYYSLVAIGALYLTCVSLREYFYMQNINISLLIIAIFIQVYRLKSDQKLFRITLSVGLVTANAFIANILYYYQLIDTYPYLIAVPIMITASIIFKGIYQNNSDLKNLEWAATAFCFLFIIVNTADNLNNSLGLMVLGVISLIAVSVGLYYRYSNYFFQGIASIIILLLIILHKSIASQSWTIYFLLIGIALIIIASVVEINKRDLPIKKKVIKFLKEFK